MTITGRDDGLAQVPRLERQGTGGHRWTITGCDEHFGVAHVGARAEGGAAAREHNNAHRRISIAGTVVLAQFGDHARGKRVHAFRAQETDECHSILNIDACIGH